MYNIFYRDSHLGSRMSGPKKVIENLVRTFEDFDVPFTLNIEKYERTIFLHWDDYHYPKYQKLKNKKNLLVGPQAWPFDPVFQKLQEYKSILAPSWWVDYKLRRHFNKNEVSIWPVGIYPPEINNTPSVDVLIYYKNRPIEDYHYMVEILQKRGCSAIALEYGGYSQDNFRDALSAVKFCVIIDNTESQGIAIQEMMACGKPLFVWDQTIWDHMGPEYSVPASSVPYWSDRCGELVSKKELIESKFDTFLSRLNDYDPVSFYEENLTPQKSLEVLNRIYEN
jgi:hypothetical protein